MHRRAARGDVAAALLHTGSIAVAILRAARALSVQKRYANEWDVQKRHGSEQGGGRCGERGASAVSEAPRRGERRNEQGGGRCGEKRRRSEQGGAARRCVSAAKGVHVRGHAGAWRARAGTRRSGLRLVRGDARPRGRRAGTRTPGGFSSRGRGPANIGQSKAHGAVWPLGRRVGAEFARPSLRGRDGTSLLSARLPRGLCGGECAAEAKSRYFRNRNGLMPA